MCVICGCGTAANASPHGEMEEHEHVLTDGTRVRHRHDHTHSTAMASGQRTEFRKEVVTELVPLQVALLDKNQRIAERNRGWFAGRGVRTINLMSSPGAGKTTLLVQTLQALAERLPVLVIEGDQETSTDADRIRATGVRAVQVNTGAGCHLDADMVQRAVHALDPPTGSLLFIENVGNLVCPALFDLGESARVVLLSVTEGDDKPLKYPYMFREADLVLITKMDLAPYVSFDADRTEAQLRKLNARIQCLSVSCVSGLGLPKWYDWLFDVQGGGAAGDGA